MAAQDPERERQRLARLYSAMDDGELAKVAADSASLTDMACDLLEEEMDRRGLDFESAASPRGRDVVESRDVVTIRKFRDLPEALLAQGSLESAGIECWLTDDNLVRLDWFISNFVGGIKLQVKKEDAEAANEILEQPIPEDFDVEGIGEYHQPRCPKCQSLDVSFEELNKPVAFATAYVGLPIPLHRRAWRCRSCKHEWQGSDSTEVEEV
ncbi:MAG TPA: hypothetical protein VEV41_15300 [Terriglobales bacterium]|nr:hypothetical protein [Terriglobales bacterium]